MPSDNPYPTRTQMQFKMTFDDPELWRFEPGARIRCVDTRATDLVYGRVYLVCRYQIAIDSGGLVDPTLVYIRRGGRTEGYWRERFQLVSLPTPRFRAGQLVRVRRTTGPLKAGDIYRVFVVHDNGLLRLVGLHLEGPFAPTRFEAVVERKISPPAPPSRIRTASPHASIHVGSSAHSTNTAPSWPRPSRRTRSSTRSEGRFRATRAISCARSTSCRRREKRPPPRAKGGCRVGARAHRKEARAVICVAAQKAYFWPHRPSLGPSG